MRAITWASALAIVLGAGSIAVAQTVCQFEGLSSFDPALTGSPSEGPIAFTFGGTLSGCVGAGATLFEGAVVSTDSGTIATGGNCSASSYDVAEFTITNGSLSCTGSIPVGEGIAAAGVATAVPQQIDCGGDGSGLAAFQLQFLIPPDPQIVEACNGDGLNDLAFSGLYETQY